MQLHWAVLALKLFGFLVWKSLKEVPVSFVPCGLSSKAELTKGGVLIIICFVFTSHASPLGYFLSISGVWSMLECWKSSLFAETSHWRHLPAWEYMQWYCKKPKSLFSKVEHHHSHSWWGGTCDSGGTATVCRGKTELHHAPGWHWYSLPSFLCVISSRPEKVVMIVWIDWHFESGHRVIHKTQHSWCVWAAQHDCSVRGESANSFLWLNLYNNLCSYKVLQLKACWIMWTFRYGWIQSEL